MTGCYIWLCPSCYACSNIFSVTTPSFIACVTHGVKLYVYIICLLDLCLCQFKMVLYTLCGYLKLINSWPLNQDLSVSNCKLLVDIFQLRMPEYQSMHVQAYAGIIESRVLCQDNIKTLVAIIQAVYHSLRTPCYWLQTCHTNYPVDLQTNTFKCR